MKRTLALAATLLTLAGTSYGQTRQAWMNDAIKDMEGQLVAVYGEGQHARITRGLNQVADFWRAEDGDDGAFKEFVANNFAEGAALDTLFERMQYVMESVFGNFAAMGRDLRRQADLDIGPMQPFDEVLAGLTEEVLVESGYAVCGVAHRATATITGGRCFYGDKNSTTARAASATIAARSFAEDVEPME